MKIYAVDDELLSGEMLENAIREAMKEMCMEYELEVFQNPMECLERIGNSACDVLFSDIRMPEMNGIDFAKSCLEKVPKLNVIFTTAYGKYMSDAFDIFVSGYIMKPVSGEKIIKAMHHLRYPIENTASKCQIQCYGNFEVFGRDGKPLHFHRSKSKEALAYLVHKKGASCTVRELSGILFEDEPYDTKRLRYLQKLIGTLLSDMKENGYADVVIRKHNMLALNTACVECDYYENPDRMKVLMEGGEYMAQYSWAETI